MAFRFTLLSVALRITGIAPAHAAELSLAHETVIPGASARR